MSTEWGKIESVGKDPKLEIEVVTSSRGLYLFIKGVAGEDKLKVCFAEGKGIKFDLTEITAQELIDFLQTVIKWD